MKSRKRLLRWASGIMLVLGAGHLSLLALTAWESITGWVDRGVWAAVPLMLADGAETVESFRNSVTFWAGPGSFAVPLILLGCLTWHLAGRGVAVPAGIGWGLAAWCALGGVLLVPSPYFAGVIAGALVIVAARKDDRSGAAREREMDLA
ncbi:DUF6463 family protein [Nonomuraea dietziae]|uniref:Uncharacterized protein n=1 Tax=Nonomuraea dietziae TaxID=65515 RepID=A0A7W5YTF1_9ACTN|nr:DUF6463 family protein [Nonomuraea dietziae]MBB3730554.1 hypothetical protein [Nonomuraea dietziae]